MKVEIPGGNTVEFPDNTPHDEVARAIDQHLAQHETSAVNLAKQAGAGAVTGLTSLADTIAQHSPIGVVARLATQAAGQPYQPQLTETAESAMGVPTPQTTPEKLARNFGALAVPMEGEATGGFGLLRHLVQAGLGAVGGTFGGEIGKQFGPTGEAIGTAAGTVAAPLSLARAGTKVIRNMTTAEKAGMTLASGERLPDVPEPTREAMAQTRELFTKRQAALGGELLPKTATPEAVTAAQAETARQPSAGLIERLQQRQHNALGERYDKLETEALPKQLSPDGTKGLKESLQTVADDFAGRPVSLRAQKFLQKVQDRIRGPVLSPDQERYLAAVDNPTRRAELRAQLEAAPTAGAIAEPATLGDLKNLRTEGRQLAKSLAKDPTSQAFVNKVNAATLDSSIAEGLPRDPQLNAEYRHFHGTDWTQGALNELKQARSPADLGKFLDRDRLTYLWDAANDTEKAGIRQTIAQWAHSVSPDDPLQAVLKKYSNADLDRFFEGAGRNGDLLRIKSATDELPKLFKQAPDLEAEFLRRTRQEALKAYKPLELPQGLTRRALYAGAIALPSLAVTGSVPLYAAGVGGVVGVSYVNRFINKGIAMALESPTGIRLLGRAARTGNVGTLLSRLSLLAGRAVAFDAAQQHHAAMASQP